MARHNAAAKIYGEVDIARTSHTHILLLLWSTTRLLVANPTILGVVVGESSEGAAGAAAIAHCGSSVGDSTVVPGGGSLKRLYLPGPHPVGADSSHTELFRPDFSRF